MTAPLMQSLTERMVGAGLAVLRFNFRGVGTSSGAWSGGINEVNDVGAAVERATEDELPLSICGWSFGAATSLRWQAVAQSDLTWVGVSPPVPPKSSLSMPGPDDLQDAKRTIIFGERDQLINVDDARAYASTIEAAFHTMAGSDHFFHFREDRVAELLIQGLVDPVS